PGDRQKLFPPPPARLPVEKARPAASSASFRKKLPENERWGRGSKWWNRKFAVYRADGAAMHSRSQPLETAVQAGSHAKIGWAIGPVVSRRVCARLVRSPARGPKVPPLFHPQAL